MPPRFLSEERLEEILPTVNLGDYQGFVVTGKNFAAACNIVIFDEEKCLHKVFILPLYYSIQTLDLTFRTVSILIFPCHQMLLQIFIKQ